MSTKRRKRRRRKKGGIGGTGTRHYARINKLFEAGEMGKNESVPHRVLAMHKDTYVESTEPDSYIPWGALPHDVVTELYDNIPAIKEILREGAIKPKQGTVSPQEQAYLSEHKWLEIKHPIGCCDEHWIIPKHVMGDIVTINKRTFTVESKCMKKEEDPCSTLLPHQRETVYIKVAAFTNFEAHIARQNNRIDVFWIDKEYSDLIDNIKQCIGISEVARQPKQPYDYAKIIETMASTKRLENISLNDALTPLEEQRVVVASTFQLDHGGRYYITMCTPCNAVLSNVETEKDTTPIISHLIIRGEPIWYACHACTCGS
jgi:hypothetical protein